MAPTSPQILKRQYYGGNSDGCYLFCGDATSRYAITAAVIVAILLLIFGARAHAQHRLRTGKPLLTYHKWMVRRTPPQNPNHFSTNPARFPPAPGPWNGRHTMPQGHDATDYALPGWQYPPPPPAYGETDGNHNESYSEHFAPPTFPPPIYESKGNGGKAATTVTQTDAVGEGSSRASQTEEREREQERTRQAVEDRERQQELEYAQAHDTMRR